MSNDETPPYAPTTPYYETGAPAPATPPTRTPRRGPLSSRLEARARLTPLPDFAALPATSPDGATAQDDQTQGLTGGSGYLLGATSDGRQADPTWSPFSGILREPGEATEALRASHTFVARWNSRADMLGACLDEYYQLTAKVNEARTLLQETERDITTLRQQQFTAVMTMRELEQRLEMHSRTELRTAYLGAAEIEMRVFRSQQERDLLISRIETLDGFMQFLSRVIATIRSIPASAMAQVALEASAAADTGARAETSATPVADDAFEELELDADEAAALAASGEVEVIGTVEEVESSEAHPVDESANAATSDE